MRQTRIWQYRINLVASLILVTVTLLVSITIFAVMQHKTVDLLIWGLQSTLTSDIEQVTPEIQRSVNEVHTVTTRPFLIAQLQNLNKNPGDTAARKALSLVSRSFLVTGLSAVAVFDNRGTKVAAAGTFTEHPSLMVALRFPGHVQLLWHKLFLLRTEMPVIKAGHLVGTVVGEVPLYGLTRMFADTARLGTSASLVLCARASGQRMACFPTTRQPKVVIRAPRSIHGATLPMGYALAGVTGTSGARDLHDLYHHGVIASYGPVGQLGLGMVLEINKNELFRPIMRQLRYVVPLVFLVLAIAYLLLRWLLSPLVGELAQSELLARQVSLKLRESESRVRAVLEHINEGIVTISENGHILLFNPGAEHMFGYSQEEVIGKNVSLLMPQPYHSEHDNYLAHYLSTSEARVIGVEREAIGLRKNRETFPVDLRISEFLLDGQRQFIGIIRDISERKAAEDTIKHLATHDVLTDLPNRTVLEDRIQQTIQRAQRTHSRFAILFCDLDEFKVINDSLGHLAGDHLLQLVAQRLKGCLRGEDTVARQGGDEFIVLLANVAEPTDAGLVGARILTALAEPYLIDGHIWTKAGASIGIAVFPQDGQDMETLLRNSDSAMYHAKATGRGKYHFFAP
ncbi:MAG: diguanylate cyclase domain-containing protein [Acidobacteriaceae bacterium]